MAEQGIMHPILGREYPTCVCPQPSGLIAKRAFSWWARSTITVRNDPQQGDGCPLSFEVLCSNRGGRGSARGCKREAIGPQARARAPRPGHIARAFGPGLVRLGWAHRPRGASGSG